MTRPRQPSQSLGENDHHHHHLTPSQRGDPSFESEPFLAFISPTQMQRIFLVLLIFDGAVDDYVFLVLMWVVMLHDEDDG